MRIETKFVIRMLMLAFIMIGMVSISSAATVDLVSPSSLPTQLKEGEHTEYTIKISGYEDAKTITIETSLVSANNKPIYDFGDLNSAIDGMYNSKITLDTSKLPNKIQVSISGNAPQGESANKYNDDVVITKLINTPLKYYEVTEDKKLVKMEPFELLINKKEIFDGTMEKVVRPELNGIKKNVQKLFGKGLVTDAQDMASELKNIQWPDNLSLLGLVKIDSSLWLNIVVILTLVIGLIVGFLIGANVDTPD